MAAQQCTIVHALLFRSLPSIILIKLLLGNLFGFAERKQPVYRYCSIETTTSIQFSWLAVKRRYCREVFCPARNLRIVPVKLQPSTLAGHSPVRSSIVPPFRLIAVDPCFSFPVLLMTDMAAGEGSQIDSLSPQEVVFFVVPSVWCGESAPPADAGDDKPDVVEFWLLLCRSCFRNFARRFWNHT